MLLRMHGPNATYKAEDRFCLPVTSAKLSKNAVTAFRFHANYFLLLRKIPDVSRQSMLFYN